MSNFQDRVIQGSGTRGTVGTYKEESLPNITGYSGLGYDPSTITPDDLFYITQESKTYLMGQTTNTAANRGLIFDASRSSLVYQNNAKVNPDNAEVMYCIKY